MIRGSIAGSVPSMIFAMLKKHGKPMGAGEVFRGFAPELKVTRISVGTALYELAAKKIVAKNGRKGSMRYSLTGAPLPERVPVKKYWKSKPSQAEATTENRETVFNFKNKTAAKVITEEVIQGAAELEKIPKFKMPKAPELIMCDSCLIYGYERGCTDCTYE